MKPGRALACRLLAASGLPQRTHRRHFPHTASICMYHAVQPEALPMPNWCFVRTSDFREHMVYLKEHFHIVPLADLPEQLALEEAERPLAVVTFDDGYRNNYTSAFPILRELEIPATIFLATDFVDTDRAMWDNGLYLALVETKEEELEYQGVCYFLNSPKRRMKAFSDIRNQLKRLPLDELLKAVQDIRVSLGQPGELALPLDSPFRMLQSSEIREMAESGWIQFGGHTAGHCILSRESEEEQAWQIQASLGETQRMTGAPCTLFAYPNGSKDDYDEVSMKCLRDSGVQLAVNTEEGPCDVRTPRLELQRYGIGAGLDRSGFAIKVHHFADRLKRGASA